MALWLTDSPPSSLTSPPAFLVQICEEEDPEEFEDGYCLATLMCPPKGFFRRHGSSKNHTRNHRGESEIALLPSKFVPLAHHVDKRVTGKDSHLDRVLGSSMAKQFGVPETLLEPKEDFLGQALAMGFSPSEQKVLCKEWAQGSVLVYAAKYKSVENKV